MSDWGWRNKRVLVLGGATAPTPLCSRHPTHPPTHPPLPRSKLLGGKGQYWEAVVHSIDPAAKDIVACFPKDAGLDEACFKVPYDVLVLAVGCTNNTFGVKGVEEHAFFFKSIDDAAALRRHVSECFERAALPQTPPEEKDKLLSFVVCGGGPTGVEVAAELHDMVVEDLVKLYPGLVDHVRVRIIELQDHLLSTYDRAISEYTGKQFKRAGIEAVLGARVLEVRGEGTGKGYVRVAGAGGDEYDIPFGACVWATGVAMHPLIKQLQAKLPPGTQTHFRSAVTNGYLEVDGSDGSIFALGDAATLRQDRALDAAGALFDRADADKNGALDLDELRALLAAASDEFPQFKEHARFLDSRRGFARWGGMVGAALEKARARAAGVIASDETPLGTLDEDTALTRAEFEELLASIDRGLRALPATAQVAKQQGEYLAKLVAGGHVTGAAPVEQVAAAKGAPPPAPFAYFHKGSLAYVGQDKAVMDVPVLGPLFGNTAGLAWRSFETVSQISPRNMVLVSLDWLRTRVFGRDISRV